MIGKKKRFMISSISILVMFIPFSGHWLLFTFLTESAGQRQRYMVVVFKRQVLLLSSAEEKKHIWFMILCAILLFEIGTIVCRILLLFDIFISCLQLYNGLEVLLKLMIFMWLQVLWIHMALNSVQANLGTILPDLYIHL